MLSYYTRLRMLAAGAVLLFCVLAGRLYDLQILERDQWEEISQRKLRFSAIVTAPRAAILSADGVVLAQDRASFDLSLIVERLPLTEVVVSDVETHLTLKGDERLRARSDAIARLARSEPLIAEIARITDRPVADVAAALYKALERVARGWQRPGDVQLIVHDIPWPVWARIDQRQRRLRDQLEAAAMSPHRGRRFLNHAEREKPFPGLRTTVGRRRVYPLGSRLCHVLGYVREYTRKEWSSLRRGGRIVGAESYRQRYWNRRWDALSPAGRDEIARLLDLARPERLPGSAEGEEAGHLHIAELIGALRALRPAEREQIARLIGDERGHLADWAVSRDLVRLNEGEQIWVGDGRQLKDKLIGARGIERVLNNRLRGKHGYKLAMRLVAPRIVEAASREQAAEQSDVHMEFLHQTRPERGEPVVLTIVSSIQAAAEEALYRYGTRGLGLQRGTAILMDLRVPERAGNILALASIPGFDPNLFVPPRSRQVAALLRDESRPLINRAIREQYPLGSVFKTLVALIALEEGVASPERTIRCEKVFRLQPGSRRRWRCEHACGPLNLVDAIVHSCNVYFYTCAHELTVDRILPWARRVGFGAVSGIDLPSEVRGTLPTRAWKARTFGGRAAALRRQADQVEERARRSDDDARQLFAEAARLRKRAQVWQWESSWHPGDTVNIGIGQGTLAVTPMQTLRLMAMIASDGKIWTPRVVRHADRVRPERIVPFSPRHLALVRRGMTKVTRDPDGTAYALFQNGAGVPGRPFNEEFPDIHVAAKTGSAQTGRRYPGLRQAPTHSWFAGFAPADRPEVAFVVLLEEAGFGAAAAGPAAVEILRAYFRNKQVQSSKFKVQGLGSDREDLER